MRILLIGGNGFIGRFVVAALKREEYAVAVFHRGTAPTPDGVEEILGDRNQLSASTQELRRFAPDGVIDLVVSSGLQAEELMNTAPPAPAVDSPPGSWASGCGFPDPG